MTTPQNTQPKLFNDIDTTKELGKVSENMTRVKVKTARLQLSISPVNKKLI